MLTFVTWESQSEALPGLAQVVEVRTYKGHKVQAAIRRWVILASYPGAQLALASSIQTGVMRGDGYSRLSIKCSQTGTKPQVLLLAAPWRAWVGQSGNGENLLGILRYTRGACCLRFIERSTPIAFLVKKESKLHQIAYMN